MELRKYQQQQRAGGVIPKPPLGGHGGGTTGASRGGLPQGWSVFTNPRTPPPPKPKTRTESSESGGSQASMSILENTSISSNPGHRESQGKSINIGHRRASVSMSTESSSPPTEPLGLKKGFSHSLLNAGTSMSPQKRTPVGAAQEVRRELPMKKGPLIQGESEKGVEIGPGAVAAVGRSPKARALWKRTTAVVAGGRKAQAKWGGKM